MKFTDQEIEEIAQRWQKDIWNQSGLVEHLFSKGIYNLEDCYNLEETDEDMEGELKEVYEWYLVPQDIADRLRDIGEVILETDFGFTQYWGRTCTGQDVLLDGTFQEAIRKNMG